MHVNVRTLHVTDTTHQNNFKPADGLIRARFRQVGGEGRIVRAGKYHNFPGQLFGVVPDRRRFSYRIKFYISYFVFYSLYY